jgi:hypothetical protein
MPVTRRPLSCQPPTRSVGPKDKPSLFGGLAGFASLFKVGVMLPQVGQVKTVRVNQHECDGVT